MTIVSNLDKKMDAQNGNHITGIYNRVLFTAFMRGIRNQFRKYMYSDVLQDRHAYLGFMTKFCLKLPSMAQKSEMTNA